MLSSTGKLLTVNNILFIINIQISVCMQIAFE